MANSFNRKKRLSVAYAYTGFRPQPTVRGIFGDQKARVITLVRRSKKNLRPLWSNPIGVVRTAHATYLLIDSARKDAADARKAAAVLTYFGRDASIKPEDKTSRSRNET